MRTYVGKSMRSMISSPWRALCSVLILLAILPQNATVGVRWGVFRDKPHFLSTSSYHGNHMNRIDRLLTQWRLNRMLLRLADRTNAEKMTKSFGDARTSPGLQADRKRSNGILLLKLLYGPSNQAHIGLISPRVANVVTGHFKIIYPLLLANIARQDGLLSVPSRLRYLEATAGLVHGQPQTHSKLKQNSLDFNLKQPYKTTLTFHVPQTDSTLKQDVLLDLFPTPPHRSALTLSNRPHSELPMLRLLVDRCTRNTPRNLCLFRRKVITMKIIQNICEHRLAMLRACLQNRLHLMNTGLLGAMLPTFGQLLSQQKMYSVAQMPEINWDVLQGKHRFEPTSNVKRLILATWRIIQRKGYEQNQPIKQKVFRNVKTKPDTENGIRMFWNLFNRVSNKNVIPTPRKSVPLKKSHNYKSMSFQNSLLSSIMKRFLQGQKRRQPDDFSTLLSRPPGEHSRTPHRPHNLDDRSQLLARLHIDRNSNVFVKGEKQNNEHVLRRSQANEAKTLGNIFRFDQGRGTAIKNNHPGSWPFLNLYFARQAKLGGNMARQQDRRLFSLLKRAQQNLQMRIRVQKSHIQYLTDLLREESVVSSSLKDQVDKVTASLGLYLRQVKEAVARISKIPKYIGEPGHSEKMNGTSLASSFSGFSEMNSILQLPDNVQIRVSTTTSFPVLEYIAGVCSRVIYAVHYWTKAIYSAVYNLIPDFSSFDFFCVRGRINCRGAGGQDQCKDLLNTTTQSTTLNGTLEVEQQDSESSDSTKPLTWYNEIMLKNDTKLPTAAQDERVWEKKENVVDRLARKTETEADLRFEYPVHRRSRRLLSHSQSTSDDNARRQLSHTLDTFVDVARGVDEMRKKRQSGHRQVNEMSGNLQEVVDDETAGEAHEAGGGNGPRQDSEDSTTLLGVGGGDSEEYSENFTPLSQREFRHHSNSQQDEKSHPDEMIGKSRSDRLKRHHERRLMAGGRNRKYRRLHHKDTHTPATTSKPQTNENLPSANKKDVTISKISFDENSANGLREKLVSILRHLPKDKLFPGTNAATISSSAVHRIGVTQQLDGKQNLPDSPSKVGSFSPNRNHMDFSVDSESEKKSESTDGTDDFGFDLQDVRLQREKFLRAKPTKADWQLLRNIELLTRRVLGAGQDGGSTLDKLDDDDVTDLTRRDSHVTDATRENGNAEGTRLQRRASFVAEENNGEEWKSQHRTRRDASAGFPSSQTDDMAGKQKLKAMGTKSSDFLRGKNGNNREKATSKQSERRHGDVTSPPLSHAATLRRERDVSVNIVDKYGKKLKATPDEQMMISFTKRWSKLRPQLRKVQRNISGSREKFDDSERQLIRLLKTGDNLANQAIVSKKRSKVEEAMSKAAFRNAEAEFQRFKSGIKLKQRQKEAKEYHAMTDDISQKIGLVKAMLAKERAYQDAKDETEADLGPYAPFSMEDRNTVYRVEGRGGQGNDEDK